MSDPEPDAPEDTPKPAKPTLVSVKHGVVFKHGVAGVDDLTPVPQAVPAASLPELRDVAHTCGVDLIEEKP